jgi:hypothetical protein
MNRKAAFFLPAAAILCLSIVGISERHASADRFQGSAGNGPTLDRQTSIRLRNEQIARQRGMSGDAVSAARQRDQALVQLERAEKQLLRSASTKDQPHAPEVIPVWSELGPKPLPNGETQQAGVTAPVSGRATAVVVDPTNANKVYLGTAQGGVWRSLNGGASWTPIFESAQSLAIGSLALAPSSPTTLYIGTGEHPGNSVNDTFFGVGVYRINNADTVATLLGPINPPYSFTSIFGQALTTTCFGGRAITKIVVHPTDPATIFVSTTGSFSGISGLTIGSEFPPLGLRGLYRSTNATSSPGSVTFQKMAVSTDASFDNPGTGNTGIWDLAFEPGNPNNLLVTVAGSSPPIGGVFRTTNALAATPSFTQVLTPTLDPDGLAMRLAINKVDAVVTVYATSNEASSCPGEKGRLRKSTDGGLNWTDVPAADGFCGGLCIYGSAIMIDPANANLVYLGGSSRGACADVLQRSTDGGATFLRDDTGLNSSAHGIFFDVTTVPATIWFVCDGGVWKRPDAVAGTAWINRNNAPLGTMQFQSVAVHPTDKNFTIGGTQDNGTVAQPVNAGDWVGAESGDGGFALIDQSATDTTNVTMYHTFSNVTNSLIGFSRTNLGSCLNVKDSWEFRGAGLPVDLSLSCDGTAKKNTNGINITDATNYYAPLALGPGTPNTLYFGTDRLYRSTNRGDTMTIVSQAPLAGSNPISTINISRTNDNVRIVGTVNGKVFATVTGSSTLTDISPTLPLDPNGAPFPDLKYISRVVIDPNNPNIAYLALSYYTPAGQGIFKTTNLNLTGTGTVTWTAFGNGIPSVPINALVVDPTNSNRVFAGTDIGVYSSEDAGANWAPYGLGLPRVAVFDLAVQAPNHLLRAATHGRGMWEIPAVTPTAAAAKISGRIVTSTGAPLAGVTVTISGDSRTIRTITDSDGRYQARNLDTGEYYVVIPSLSDYTFAPAMRSYSLVADQADALFTARADAVQAFNPIDTAEYFVRQQYLDFLGREPDQNGFEYWSNQLNQCGTDAECLRTRRISIASAFFMEREFQDTGSYIYDLYKGSLGRRPTYEEYSFDRQQVIGGAQLDAEKTALAESFVQRAEFVSKYEGANGADSFVDALLQTVQESGVDLSSRRATYVSAYNSGNTVNASRALVVRALADETAFKQAEYNAAFVLSEYFGYLRRNPDQRGYEFWLNVLNNGDPGNYRGMVCAFINSVEYQRRFSTVVSRSDADCGR